MLNTLIIAGLTIFVQLLVGVYVYGKMANQVVTNTKAIDQLNDRVDDHGTRIARLEGALN